MFALIIVVVVIVVAAVAAVIVVVAVIVVGLSLWVGISHFPHFSALFENRVL